MARYEGQRGRTISCHNGGSKQANRYHNIRNEQAIKNMSHIDHSLTHLNENWVDIPPRKAYEQIFGEALKEYNDKQKRADRKIDDYFRHISKNALKHTVYEIIYQIGDKDDTGIYDPVAEECLREMIDNWKTRNPALALIGAYLHKDELTGTLHVHADYVPVATGFKKGMAKQNSLSKALQSQGFVTKGAGSTAQMKWEDAERKALEAICMRHGIEVYHPKESGVHLDTPEYKLAREREKEARETAVKAEEELEGLKGSLLTARQVDQITIKKKMFGKDIAYMDAGEAENLLKTAAEVSGTKNQNAYLKSYIEKLESMYEQQAEEIKKKEAELSVKEDAFRNEKEIFQEESRKTEEKLQRQQEEAEASLARLQSDYKDLSAQYQLLDIDKQRLQMECSNLKSTVESERREGRLKGYEEGIKRAVSTKQNIIQEAEKSAVEIRQEAQKEASQMTQKAMEQKNEAGCILEQAHKEAKSIIQRAEGEAEEYTKIRNFYDKLMYSGIPGNEEERKTPEFWVNIVYELFDLRKVAHEFQMLKDMLTFVPDFIINRARTMYDRYKHAREANEPQINTDPPSTRKKIR